MTLCVACNTNVLVSALIAHGPPTTVIELAIEGRIELLLPAPAIVELERVLAKKLGFTAERLAAATERLEYLAVETLAVADSVDARSGDPDDDAILACTLAGRADVLV